MAKKTVANSLDKVNNMPKQDPFKEYIKDVEPSKHEKSYVWQTAIGLQAVDGLEPSTYLRNTAIRNIEGEISFEEADTLLQSYYEKNPTHDEADRTEEADKVSLRVAKILSENAFSFTPNEYMAIHKKLFTGIYPQAGEFRDYNITKKEWVLNGATVLYGSASELRATLAYDFSEEKKFSYKNLTMDKIIQHLAKFVARLWQIHVFGEGNTRTTAVFFIKYLRTLGFAATNDIFAENAWYFRNALVRANYNDLKNGVHETTEFLELFLRNLLLAEENSLQNRALHIRNLLKEEADVYDDSPSSHIRNETVTGEATHPESEASLEDIDKVLTLEEAAEMWGKSTDALRQACIARNGKPPRFHIGVEARQSKRIWLVTYEGMKRLYGEPVKE